jgi:hypothetical protein
MQRNNCKKSKHVLIKRRNPIDIHIQTKSTIIHIYLREFYPQLC